LPLGRYYGTGTYRDHEIHAKISRVLKGLEMYSKERKETERDDAELVLLTETSEGSVTSEDMNLSNKGKYEKTYALNDLSSDEDFSDEEFSEISSTFLKQEDNESLNSSDIGVQNFGTNEIVDSDTSGISGNEEGPEESAVRWKANLALKAADAFLERQSTTHNLWKLVYGKCNVDLQQMPVSYTGRFIQLQ
jgi:hypothetical protein